MLTIILPAAAYLALVLLAAKFCGFNDAVQRADADEYCSSDDWWDL